jgi:hypothetical protein
MLLLTNCSNSKVEAPEAEFELQVFDKDQGAWVTIDKPYQVMVNQSVMVISYNKGEYNSFYQGDSILESKTWIKRIYSDTPKINHRGLALFYDAAFEGTVAEIKYLEEGEFSLVFISGAVGEDGTVVDFKINRDNKIIVSK